MLHSSDLMITSHAAMKDRNRMGFKDLYVGYTAITKALWLKHFHKEDENWYIQYNMSCIVDFSESWACVHRFHTSPSCRKHQINIQKDKKEEIQELFATTGGGESSGMGWLQEMAQYIWYTVRVCCGGFKSQSFPEYHLLHTVTLSGRRSQAEFHYESLDITFISQITRKHKTEKEPASELSRVRDRSGERTCTTYREILA